MIERIEFAVNGTPVVLETDPTVPLLATLREDMNLSGSRHGCGAERCGACMVLIDGKPEYACSREVGTVVGRTVTTVEGLSAEGALHPLQQAFLDEQAGQCGYCLSGIVMSAAAMIRDEPEADAERIAEVLDGHLCRCGAHRRIMRAVAEAAAAIVASKEGT